MRHHSFHVLGEGVVGLLNIFLTSYLGIVLSNHFKFGWKQKEAVEYLQDCKCVSELVESLLSMFNVVQQHVYTRWQGTVFLVEEMWAW